MENKMVQKFIGLLTLSALLSTGAYADLNKDSEKNYLNSEVAGCNCGKKDKEKEKDKKEARTLLDSISFELACSGCKD